MATKKKTTAPRTRKARKKSKGEVKNGQDVAPGRWMAESREFARAIGWAILIAVFLRFFVIEAFKIPSGSMLPTLEVGDHIFVNKFIYGPMIPLTTRKLFQPSHPKIGDVIVFKYPEDLSQNYIKRVVAGPGDHLKVVSGSVYVNGSKYKSHSASEGYVLEGDCRAVLGTRSVETLGSVSHEVFDTGRTTKDDFDMVEVPEGHVFVMGDNRDHSDDSRSWGFVPYGNVKGKAMFVWLSLNYCSGRCPPEAECGGRFRWGRMFSGVQ